MKHLSAILADRRLQDRAIYFIGVVAIVVVYCTCCVWG